MKTRSAFDVMEQTSGGFYHEEECKIPMLVSSASNQVHFKVFPSLKDPVSLTPIQTIRQSPFSIWDYTFSLRVKVMNVTEHAVCNRDQRYMDTYILLFSCTCARVHFSPVIVQLVKTRFDDNFFLRRVLCSNLKRTCRCFFF